MMRAVLALTFVYDVVNVKQIRSHSKQFQHFLELLLDWRLSQALKIVQKIQTWGQTRYEREARIIVI